MSTVSSLSAALCLSLLSYWIVGFSRRRNLPYPPGPRGLPIIGNVLSMPKSHLWLKASEWGKDHGNLVFVQCFGSPLLFLNSYEDANELLDKRSTKYSSRPSLVMANELERWDWLATTTPYNDALRKYRTYIHRFFQSPEVLDYKPLQIRETHLLLNALLDDPKDYAKHVRRLPGAVIMMNVYGHEVTNENDPVIHLADETIRIVGDVVQFPILDLIPWLKYIPEWFPGGGFHKVAREARKLSYAVRNEAHEQTKERMANGDERESMTSVLVSENILEDGTILNEGYISAAAAATYLGGADTSATTIMTFILAIPKYPEIQRRGQEEIDAIIGCNRLPSFEDKEQLPYVRAICTEVLRWESILPLIPPHFTTEDDEYKGYFIPKGTTVFANAWEMAHNPTIYPEPHDFKPERWLGPHQPLRPEKYAFGFGRRLCPGQNWAENWSVFIAVASLLAAFDFEKARDSSGRFIVPNDSYDTSFDTWPLKVQNYTKVIEGCILDSKFSRCGFWSFLSSPSGDGVVE
ncbi:cytochrome P450 [Schizopora paradoxa]|uniref:Cytochrome P450 n=1 Tax=Schizopora paradoxa TaxID=27342 RepID=A0A0H2R8K4_9AGAM|nr:cytochrome P450 [Schizopora paradoxa]